MKDELFDERIESVREGGALLRGEKKASRRWVVEEPDVAAIRDHYGLSQARFAALLGISVRPGPGPEPGIEQRSVGMRRPAREA